ncbi:cellulose-binding domain-containing protein [Cellulomonas sp. NS3]|uniref:cellulose-binding domain-containing protein n=1 Tax=Cellulomonas sp. NS3 TaxID=2973977 RepID=UPI0021621E17|nr:cellulose-binding domain-containing protein [Cellulomonas sp. NS3]
MRTTLRHRTSRLVAGLATLAVGAVTAAGLAVSAQAAAACTVTYQPSSWPGGFTTSVRVTPGDAVSGWRVTWTWPGDQKVSGAWNASVTQSGSSVTATNASWNGNLAAGSSAEFGLQGTFGSSNASPTDFAVNGVACNGQTPSPTPTPTPTVPTTPSPTPTVVPTPTVEPTPTATPTLPPTPTPTPTPTTGPNPQCGSSSFCDGFETQTGTAPSGAWTVGSPNCSGTGTVSVDTAVAHSGSRSLRVDGVAGYCNHVFAQAAGALSGTGSTAFVRFYVRHTTPLPAAHTTFLAMRDSADGGKDLRMGGQNGALQWNRESDDATLPEQSPTGVSLSAPLPTNTWSCVEYSVGRDGRLSTWLDGTLVTGLVNDGTPTRDVDGQWGSRAGWAPVLTDLRLGWESYGDGSDTLWYDDVAVSSSRIGC